MYGLIKSVGGRGRGDASREGSVLKVPIRVKGLTRLAGLKPKDLPLTIERMQLLLQGALQLLSNCHM